MKFDIDKDTKQIKIEFDKLELQKFEIIEDAGTGIKSVEDDIHTSVVQILTLDEILINRYLPNLGLHLPSFVYFDYDVQLEYQDGGLAIGVNIQDFNSSRVIDDFVHEDN